MKVKKRDKFKGNYEEEWHEEWRTLRLININKGKEEILRGIKEEKDEIKRNVINRKRIKNEEN